MINTPKHPALLTDSFVGNFNELMNDILYDRSANLKTFNRIALNLYEKENGYQLQAELPGFKKEDLKVNVEDEVLTISAERKPIEIQDGEKRTLAEIRDGIFKRSVRLPKNADINKIEASYENGILSLHMAKRKDSLPKSIEIK